MPGSCAGESLHQGSHHQAYLDQRWPRRHRRAPEQPWYRDAFVRDPWRGDASRWNGDEPARVAELMKVITALYSQKTKAHRSFYHDCRWFSGSDSSLAASPLASSGDFVERAEERLDWRGRGWYKGGPHQDFQGRRQLALAPHSRLSKLTPPFGGLFLHRRTSNLPSRMPGGGSAYK